MSYSYDVFGNKVSMTTYRDFAATYTNWGCGIPSAPSGDTTRWLYDEASGSMTNKVYADGNGTKYEYDAHGRLTKRTWARGIDTTYTFNIWGLLARTDYSDSTPSVVLTYDAMGRQTRAVDAAGITTFAYDSFGSLTNETVVGVAGTNTIERFYDAFGRDAGYALNGVRQSTLGYDPATGRLASMQIPAIEDEQNHCPPPPLFSTFQWTYLEGSDLKSSLAYPNGLSASWTYDANNQLLQVKNAFDVAATPSPSQTNIISQYDYVYDAAGRRISVSKSGIAFDHADTIAYAYNTRSELTNAVASVDSAYRYAYGFDDIGNRETSFERGTNSVYVANQLNQYTAVDDFTPQFDDDGNQTLIKTSTGIWSVIYNGENRPVLWTCGDTHITMKFDRMGRRVEYLETVTSDEGGSQSLATATNAHHRFVYEGYLCIQRLNAAANNAIDLIFAWDPAEPVATRPLMIEKPGKCMLHVTHDGNKNVSDLVFFNGGSGVAAHYEYAPFGALTASTCNSTSNAYDYRTYNPFRFSSEYADDVLGLVYYNYRHYESTAGRWLSRDRVQMINEYRVIDNAPLGNIDVLGGATDRRRSCKCDKTKINCLGYAIGANYCVDPYTMSVDSLMESLKYKGSDVSDKECKCEACDKELVYVYIYINPGEFAELNAQVNIDLNKLPDEEVARLYRLFRQIFLEGHPNPLSEEDFWCSRDFGVDYHAMKKDCSDENGKWSYVSSRFNKGDVRAAPKELDSDSFFDNDYQVIAGKCYKKAKGK